MDALPECPICAADCVYEDGAMIICPMFAHVRKDQAAVPTILAL